MANLVVENTHPSEEVHESQIIFRLLVPVQTVGGIIGSNGEYINEIREETKAGIKLFNGPPGTDEIIVLISAKEEPDLPISPAIDGLLKIHKLMIDTEADVSNARSSNGGKMVTRLLVPAPHAGSLVGTKGNTLKSIEASSNCTIRFRGGEDLPVFAATKDSLVEIHGEPTLQYKALEMIATHLQKFLFDHDVLLLCEMLMQKLSSLRTQNTPPQETWGLPVNVGFGGHSTILQGQSSSANKIIRRVPILRSLYGVAVGIYGLDLFSKASGATIFTHGSREPGEIIMVISGTPLQVEIGQKLIKNYMCDALVPKAQNPAGQV